MNKSKSSSTTAQSSDSASGWAPSALLSRASEMFFKADLPSCCGECFTFTFLEIRAINFLKVLILSLPSLLIIRVLFFLTHPHDLSLWSCNEFIMLTFWQFTYFQAVDYVINIVFWFCWRIKNKVERERTFLFKSKCQQQWKKENRPFLAQKITQRTTIFYLPNFWYIFAQIQMYKYQWNSFITMFHFSCYLVDLLKRKQFFNKCLFYKKILSNFLMYLTIYYKL